MSGEIIHYFEMCSKEGTSLQKGMNWRIGKSHSVFLMSTRSGAPYDDEWSEDGKYLIYEGHNEKRSKEVLNPEELDQPRVTAKGRLTENGKFEQAAIKYKNNEAAPERIRVYEKLREGVWAFNGLFHLTDAWQQESAGRLVFKFKLQLVMEPDVDGVSIDIEHARYIPSKIKQEVFVRDGGKCRECGSSDNLHFDHILPYSKGGTSIDAKNIQILCQRHNLIKSNLII